VCFNYWRPRSLTPLVQVQVLAGQPPHLRTGQCRVEGGKAKRCKAGPPQVVAQKDRGCAGRKEERPGRQSHSRETEDGPILGSQNTQER